ncbi:DUF3861 domain-containing protein [Shewanella sp. A3A]|uniref:DUF3861 domain-containing protein n=1 Tax=Shewanella electrica TaxID=515560 RepID=A0ABT2FHY0_9GAMM|nr:DUF3861 domain-containing protein [Shewanella electrica]MCH1918235.1 DUF3861 domain-containing protein [Shewanella ferrihydritica]MCH1924008.1 DUF3861 domain-containing protein [Shewanella electrica]MCS4555911.1 DUF3861 domain-containing protein [Shewanella electrica]
MRHQYRITLEKLDEQQQTTQALSFETENHDDIFNILSKVDGKFDFTDEQTKSFIIGLKLFGEVIMQQRKHPLFEELEPQMKQFMKKLKRGE